MKRNDTYRMMRHIAKGVRKCPAYDTAEAMADILDAFSRISSERTDEADAVDAAYVEATVVRRAKALTPQQRQMLVTDLAFLGAIFTEAARGVGLTILTKVG